VPLSNVTVTDDQLGVTPVYVSGDTNGDSQLDVGEVWLFQATGIAVEGQYANIGTVTGTPPDGPNVTDSNPSHYFGSFSSQPGINIIKLTNGEDADTPTGPTVEVGSTVTWTYEVRNTGNVPLSNVTVTDNQAGVVPVYVSGDTNGDSLLDQDEVWLFQATGTAVAGQYANVGTVTGTPPDGPNVTDDNPSHYFGVEPSSPGIDITKFTNGEDADTPTGPDIEIGTVVTWTYQVRNTGNVPLSNVTVTDDQPGVTPAYVSGDTNGDSLLDVGEVWLFQATGIAVGGQYANMGTVTGTPPDGPNVTDSNPSHYFGVDELPPTSLPVGEQPQEQQNIFLPTIESGE
jgi:large repetitive protein